MSEENAAASAEDDWAAAMAEQAAAEPAPGPSAVAPAGRPAADMFQEFAPGGTAGQANDISMIMDIPVQLTVELGRTKIPIKQILQLAQGSVIELDGLAGEPMNVLINGCLIAQGEVVVVNDKFGIRLIDIITPSERIRKLNK
ncbi:MAG: flagellar motor switch protein FliN [Burkholderiales bacterium]|nr:flagellar motor switch protein FliN [Burkholderiales bacterium]